MKRRLSARFERATTFAIRAHNGQVRKGSGVPYVSHPMAVAALVLEYGGNETQAIGALLHDVIEDCGVSERELRRRFGGTVARIVSDCSDYVGPRGARKPPWKKRKQDYIERLATVPPQTLLVSAADKLHNARAILHDLEHVGQKTWDKFSAPPLEIAWYYNSLTKTYRRRSHASLKVLLEELEKAVTTLSRAARHGKSRSR